MDENEHTQAHLNEELQKLSAARELLQASKMSLQLVDEHLRLLEQEREALKPAADTSYEHRVYWLGAQDALDEDNGIQITAAGQVPLVGWGNPKLGWLRNQADAAFVVTQIMVARERASVAVSAQKQLAEGWNAAAFTAEDFPELYLRLTDSNTGRSLITGSTQTPWDRDRGAVPMSYLSSARFGTGPNLKNKLFSEFTLPRAALVKAEVFNMGRDISPTLATLSLRCFVTLFGYKVYGG